VEAGKGERLCQALADYLGWHLLDSGAIYRVLALAALRHQIDFSMEADLIALAIHLDVSFQSQNRCLRVMLDKE